VFSIDDRAGNIITTVSLFVIAAAILYLARTAFLILLLSVFFCALAGTRRRVDSRALAPLSEKSLFGDCSGLPDRNARSQ
jgi:hypothetical protein